MIAGTETKQQRELWWGLEQGLHWSSTVNELCVPGQTTDQSYP